MFEAFSVLNDTTHLNSHGVGLGLLISNGLVYMLSKGKEKINVFSKIKEGSCFNFRILRKMPENDDQEKLYE